MKDEIDKSNIRKIISGFPKQFRVGLERAENVKVRGNFDAVIICGMGGSALPGDILDMWQQSCQIGLPLFINRNYRLPVVSQNCLAVCISYSGNTEETLYSYREAKKKGLKVAAITTGGKLGELCRKDKTPVAIIPSGVPPRLAIGYQFAALMKILSNAGIIQNESKSILALEKDLRPKKEEKRGKELAKELKGKIPIIYASTEEKILAQIWKINFFENAKILAFSNFFPELCHNEINGFWKINEMQIPSQKIQVLVLQDKKSYSRILKQMQIIKGLIEKEGVNVRFVKLPDKGILEKIFSNLLLAFWTSYHLALLYKVDPSLTKMIEEFKKKLRSKR